MNKIMYDEFIKRAIEEDRLEDLLCGSKDYEVEVSKFTSDVFPTDINAILVNCIYKQKEVIESIDYLFLECLKNMIEKNACKLYIAILYFDACIFQEERKKAAFNIEKELLVEKIKEAVKKRQHELEEYVVFENGMKKIKPINNIINFSKYYEKKYGFSII